MMITQLKLFSSYLLSWKYITFMNNLKTKIYVNIISWLVEHVGIMVTLERFEVKELKLFSFSSMSSSGR